MHVPRRLVAFALLAASACASAGAAPPGDRPPSRRALRAACADDYRRLCADVPRGEGRIAACFEAHAQDLSPGCRDALAAARASRTGPGGDERAAR